MKNLVSKVFKLASLCLIFCLAISLNNANASFDHSTKIETQTFANAGTYSWSSHASANSYQVVLTPRAGGSSIIFNTTNTWISLAGVPSGIYNVTVTAIISKTNSVIIVEDVIIA